MRPAIYECSGRLSAPPDRWGPRPTDPNELAKWMVEQTTSDADEEKIED